MGLNMYLKETYSQTKSMNLICINITQGMEEVVASIDYFERDTELQGESYRTAKNYMSQIFSPLSKGIIYLCEELIRQNDKYPKEFKVQVSTTDVIEDEVLQQIQEIDRLKLDIEKLSIKTPELKMIYIIFDNIKQKLQRKLEKLYEFNSFSSSNYDVAFELASTILQGLTQVQNGKGFNTKTRTFNTKGMDLSWVEKLDEIHYTEKAKELYGTYLEKHPENLERIVTIIKYEEENPEYVKQTNNFLMPLELEDTIEIKYLIYIAEEPYRTLALKHLHKFRIASTKSEGRFDPRWNNIKFNIEEDRNNPRGKYYTFFHEIGHAIDYYSGKESGMKGYYSDKFTIDGKTLNDHMYEDVENNIRMELEKELKSSDYENLDSGQKKEMINNVTDNLLNQNKHYMNLTQDEIKLQRTIRITYNKKLSGADNECASDIYGGVTNHMIRGTYGHNKYYWINKKGKRVNEPSLEGFAEYYGRVMAPIGRKRDAGLKSIEKFLPASKQYMDDMIESMVRR